MSEIKLKDCDLCHKYRNVSLFAMPCAKHVCEEGSIGVEACDRCIIEHLHHIDIDELQLTDADVEWNKNSIIIWSEEKEINITIFKKEDEIFICHGNLFDNPDAFKFRGRLPDTKEKMDILLELLELK